MMLDAGKVLTLIGLPNSAGLGGGVDLSLSRIKGDLKGELVSAFSNGYISDANRSSITAGNNINGKTGYAIISINGDIESSKDKGADKNFDKGFLPVIIEKDINTKVDFEAVSFNRNITEVLNFAADLVDQQK